MDRRGSERGSPYDDIAEHFDSTRRRPWPETAEFIGGLKRGSLVLDVGCGNGRNAAAAEAAGHRVVGFDSSLAMLATAARRCACQLVLADAASAPFKSRTFDAALAVAVVHHVRTEPGRVAALREVGRALKPGGRALVGVWAREQERLAGRCDANGDATVDWKLPDGRVRARFYHLYDEASFRGALKAAGLMEVQYFFRCDNHYAVVEPEG